MIYPIILTIYIKGDITMKDQIIDVEWELIIDVLDEHHLVNWLTLGSALFFCVYMSAHEGYTITQIIYIIQRSGVADMSPYAIIMNVIAIISIMLYNLIRRR